MRVHFVFVGEGNSDAGLIPHIKRLLIAEGASEVTGTAPDFGMIPEEVGRTVVDKLRTALRLESSANLFIIHRDADARDAAPRHLEIAQAAAHLNLDMPWIAVVPVQETEAWLLLDEAAIRSVAGNPTGTTALSLPVPARVEQVARPKEQLDQALVLASELTGRRATRFRASLPSKKRQLLEQLPVGGRLEHVPSWVRFRQDIAAALRRLH